MTANVCAWLMRMTAVDTHRLSDAGWRTTRWMKATSARMPKAATDATRTAPVTMLPQCSHCVGSVIDSRASPKAAQLPGGTPRQAAASGRQTRRSPKHGVSWTLGGATQCPPSCFARSWPLRLVRPWVALYPCIV